MSSAQQGLRLGMGMGGLAWLVLLSSTVAADARKRLALRGNGAELGETPLIAELDRGAMPPGLYTLKRQADGREVSASVFEDGRKLFLGALVDRVAAQGPDAYTIEA